MEEIPLADVRKTWRQNVASMGSIPHAQCYKDCMQKICQALATAFAPSKDLAIMPLGKASVSDQSIQTQSTTNQRQDDEELTGPQLTDDDLATQSPSINSKKTTDDQKVLKQTMQNKHFTTTDDEMHENHKTATSAEITGTGSTEEHPASGSEQSVDKTDEATVITTGPTDDTKELSGPDAEAEAEAVSPDIEAVSPSFYPAPLEPAYTDLHAVYLNFLYHDRFILLSDPTFLLFLSDQTRLSHSFLRYLIDHPFGIRYVHRDGANANHGITPFQYPFRSVNLKLPLSQYFDYRWALLNDPAWLGWVSTENFLMAAFWAELSFRGGLGVMQRRKGRAERESTSATWLL